MLPPTPNGYSTELPPRARRILGIAGAGVSDSGTTSACAENTDIKQQLLFWPGNYLRVRGEYYRISSESSSKQELPPSMRRIPE